MINEDAYMAHAPLAFAIVYTISTRLLPVFLHLFRSKRKCVHGKRLCYLATLVQPVGQHFFRMTEFRVTCVFSHATTMECCE